MYTITLAEGTRLEPLELNGNNYIAKKVLEDSVFEGNLGTVTISDGENTETHRNMVLIQNKDMDGSSWFILGETTEKEAQQAAMATLFAMLAADLPDGQALEVAALYANWEDLIGTEAAPGLRFQYDGGLWKVVQEHTFAAEWKPDEAHSLYTRLNETHSGETPGDAIPFQRNMECFEGLYYTDAESPGVMYRCTRDSGIPLHNMPHELVGHYFEIAKEG